MLWASFIISRSSTSKSPAEQNIDIACQSCDGHVMVMWWSCDSHVMVMWWSWDIMWQCQYGHVTSRLTEVAEEVFGNLEERFVLFLDGQFSLEGKSVGKYRSTETQHKAHVFLILSWESDERKCIIVRQERELLKIKVGGKKGERKGGRKGERNRGRKERREGRRQKWGGCNGWSEEEDKREGSILTSFCCFCCMPQPQQSPSYLPLSAPSQACTAL